MRWKRQMELLGSRIVLRLGRTTSIDVFELNPPSERRGVASSTGIT